MDGAAYTDASGSKVTARTWEGLKQEAKDGPVQITANAAYNSPRDVSPLPASTEALRPLSLRARPPSPLRRQSRDTPAVTDIDKPITAFSGGLQRRTGAKQGEPPAAAGAKQAAPKSRPGTAKGSKKVPDSSRPTARQSPAQPARPKSPTKAAARPASATATRPVSAKSKPAWADVPVAVPAANAIKERLPSITAPERRLTGSRPGTPSNLGGGGGSRPGTPSKPTIPPLTLGSVAEAAITLRVDAGPAYEQNGLAKPMSPMLRRTGSTVEGGGGGHSQPALPQLSRTGGLTPRSLGASGRLPSARLGSPRQSSLAPGQQRSGSISSAKPSPDSSSSKPTIAFGKLLPPAPTLKASGGPGGLHDSSEASETAGPGEKSRASGSSKQPGNTEAAAAQAASAPQKGGDIEGSGGLSVADSSRLGRKRTSGSGSRRASTEGSQPPDPRTPLVAAGNAAVAAGNGAVVAGNGVVEAPASTADTIAALSAALERRRFGSGLRAAGTIEPRRRPTVDIAEAPARLTVAGGATNGLRRSSSAQPEANPATLAKRRPTGDLDRALQDSRAAADAQSPSAAAKDRAQTGSATSVTESRAADATLTGPAAGNGPESQRPPSPRLAAARRESKDKTQQAAGNRQPEAAVDTQQVPAPRLPATPRSASRLGTPRGEAAALPRGSTLPAAASTSAASARRGPVRSGSGLVSYTTDGWVKEDSILAHSPSEIAARREQLGEITVDSLSKQASLPVSLRSAASLQSRKEFLGQPGPTTAAMQCTILRDTSSSKMYPTYSLYLDDPAELLMAACKRRKSKTSNYVLSVDDKDLKRGAFGYCGKVRSNFVGLQFLLFDGGAKPTAQSRGEGKRTEVGMVRYQYNVLGTRGPRKMTVIIPRPGGDGRLPSAAEADGSMTDRLKNSEGSGNFLFLKNKAPKWNEPLGAYCLNFGGRVTHASVKNFQLVSEEDPDRVILQFGKIGKDKFSMDFQSPMSALQAFEVCLTSFDGKLACE